MVYDGESAWAYYPSQQPSHTTQGGCPPASAMTERSSQPHFIHIHPYNEPIEKFVSMGFWGDHVVSMVQRMQDTEHRIDF